MTASRPTKLPAESTTSSSRRTGADEGTGVDPHVVAELGVRVDDRRRVRERTTRTRTLEAAQHNRERLAHVVDEDERLAATIGDGGVARHDDGGRARLQRFLNPALVDRERQRAIVRFVDRRDPVDRHVAVAAYFSTGRRG